MSLLRDTAREALQSFNPRNDDPNGQSNIPAGEYDAMLLNAEHKVFESGWEAFSLSVEIVQGDYEGRKEFINVGFRGDKIPDFVYNKNIKMVSQLAFVCGLELTDEDWTDESSLQWAFKEGVGRQFVMKITETKNKKDPSNPYRNFSFEAYADDPFANAVQDVQISDDDLPFD